MSLNLNKVMLAGNLTRDPEVRTLPNGSAIANFGLAINRKYKAGEERREEVTFVDVECFGTTAQMVGQYLTKGRGAYVEGRLKLDQWDDKTTGQKRSKLKIVAEQVHFLTSGSGGGKAEEPPVAQSSRARLPDEGEVPF